MIQPSSSHLATAIAVAHQIAATILANDRAQERQLRKPEDALAHAKLVNEVALKILHGMPAAT